MQKRRKRDIMEEEDFIYLVFCVKHKFSPLGILVRIGP